VGSEARSGQRDLVSLAVIAVLCTALTVAAIWQGHRGWPLLLAWALLVAALLVDYLRMVRPNRARIRRLVQDHAGLQQAEAALRESQAMLRMVLDAIPVRVHWKDVHSVYRGCNQRFAQDAELASPEELVGKTDFDLPWPQYAEFYRERDRLVLGSGEPLLEYEQPRSTSSGEIRWLRQSKLPLRDATGAMVGVLTAYEDVTERKAAADALRESERKYRELVENANSIILRLDRNGIVTFLNEFGQRFFGFTAAELLGRPVVGTIAPATEDGGRDLRALLEDVCADPDRHQLNVNQNVCRDGRRVWVAWTNRAVFDEQGKLVGVFSVGSDITEQRRAEEQLRQARQELEERVVERTAELRRANAALQDEIEVHRQATLEIVRLNDDLQARAAELATANARLQELDRLKSEFLATMSHELRTPLNSIIGFTGILRQGMAGPVNEEQAKQLGMVHSSATHLLSLINDLLDLSRIEAGRIELDLRPFDLASVVAEVQAGCHPAMAQKGLAFRAELPADGLPLVGDRKRCYQVLLNLVGNAVKFTEHGEVCVTAARDGDRLRITVADTGIGIRPEHLPLLFEAFRQVDGSARRVYEGTGLGLYLCRKLLGLMRGDISVESAYGRGSRFTFTIPTHPQQPAVPAEVRA
jgi:PAS domain S-box-containing protein